MNRRFISVASAGQYLLSPDLTLANNSRGFTNWGNVTLIDGSSIGILGGGEVLIRAGALTLDRSIIVADDNSFTSGAIDSNVKGAMRVENQAEISTVTFGESAGGNIKAPPSSDS
jgi:hypothetical protein